MKNGKLIGSIGDILLVLGSALYMYTLIAKIEPFVLAISLVYAVALVFKGIYMFMTREERKAAKAAAKAEKGKAV